MLPTVRKDILSLLPQVIAAVKDEDVSHLSQLSNHTVHDASIYQDEDSLSFAILVYALSKVVARCCEAGVSLQSFFPPLRDALDALKRDDEVGYRSAVKVLVSVVSRADSKMKLYIQEVFDQARLKKGSKLHEHGLSLAKTAEVLGIGLWELQSYVGKQVYPADVVARDVSRRLAFARSLF